MASTLDRNSEPAMGGDTHRDVADGQVIAGYELARRQHFIGDCPKLVEPLGGRCDSCQIALFRLL
jgi:hypothetical protein